MEIHEQFFRLTFLVTIFFSIHSFALAQQGSGTGIGTISTPNGFYLPEDDTKGSVVRGRVFYQNTGKPLRRGWIGFQKIRELVEKPKDADGKIAPVSRGYGNEKFVLTNDSGEFMMKGVKAGIYQPIARVQGILNPGFEDRENLNFQQITIDGVSEIQANIAVQRGGAISGRVTYADGDPVIGARIQILVKKDGRFTPYYNNYSSASSVTDDIGSYRFSALPANEYIVSVAEPSVQSSSANSVNGYNASSFSNNSQLKTFYPNVAVMTEAKTVGIYDGQEQSEINLNVPDRRLFTISGIVTAKNGNLPLKNMLVSFYKIGETASFGYGSNQLSQATADAQGNWTLVDLPAGKYQITAAPNNRNTDYGNQPKAVDNQPKYARVSKDIEIDNQNLSNVLLELSVQATISGKVFLEDDKPLPDAIFLGAFDEKNKISSSASIRNSSNRNNQQQKPTNDFRIEGLSAGNFYLTAMVNNGKYFVKSITLNNKDVKNSPLEIKDGENVEGVRVILSSDVGTVKGKINNYENKGRTFVILIPADKSPGIPLFGGRAMPKPNGEFEINAAPGEYSVVIRTEANRSKTDIGNAPKITLKAKETVNLNLDYPK